MWRRPARLSRLASPAASLDLACVKCLREAQAMTQGVRVQGTENSTPLLLHTQGCTTRSWPQASHLIWGQLRVVVPWVCSSSGVPVWPYTQPAPSSASKLGDSSMGRTAAARPAGRCAWHALPAPQRRGSARPV